MFDCHLHSNFSGDSNLPVDTACEKAVELGLNGLVFTDHLDFDYPDDIYPMIDFDKYSKHIDETKIRFEGQLKVLKGIEVGIQPHVMEDTFDLVSKYNFDMVIASTHIIDKKDPYTGSYYEGKDKKQADIRYLEEILHAVRNYKNYDVVGHIGYIRRYNNYDDKTLSCNDYCDLIDDILKTVIGDGKGIEVNTSGYRGGLGTPVPDYDIVMRYRELGGEILTLGSDAHNSHHIGYGFELAKEKLMSIGFKQLAYFEKRKLVFYSLQFSQKQPHE